MQKLIVLDPGHGGRDPGAIGKKKTRESDVALRLSRRIEFYLRASQIKTIFTRSADVSLASDKNEDLKKRAEIANINNADALVSIHCNASENRMAEGFEIWTTKGVTNSDALATIIFNNWKNSMSGKVRQDLSDGDPDKEANFAVIYKTKCPSCLIEVAFISNEKEEVNLNNSVWIDKAAKAISSGIKEWLENS